jgi:hypothetical protein
VPASGSAAQEFHDLAGDSERRAISPLLGSDMNPDAGSGIH